jgi:hypothetical protein
VFGYSTIPTKAQFKRGNAVVLGMRGHDPELIFIEDMLGRLESAPDDFVLMAELFFGLNGWLNAYHDGASHIERRRYPAISLLNEAAHRKLRWLCGAGTQGQLSRILGEIFGSWNEARPFERDRGLATSQRKAAKLIFDAGRAYRVLTEPGLPRGMHRVDSSWFESDFARGLTRANDDDGLPPEGFAPFVMSPDREFYMARRGFRPAFFADVPIAAAGTMRIVDGRIVGLRGDGSRGAKLSAVLQGLRVRGVDIAGITVHDGDSRAEPALAV